MTLGAARNVHHFIDEVHIGNVGGGNDTRIKDEMMELLTDSQQAGAAVGLGLGTVIALCYRLGTSVSEASMRPHPRPASGSRSSSASWPASPPAPWCRPMREAGIAVASRAAVA
jgi:hypothetical protein